MPTGRERPDGSGMIPTRSNKRKFELDDLPTTEPIVFMSPGLKPDVRLMVFKQEFHVHSIILKLHSNYFRKFLDSPDKSDTPASALFRYEYVSVVDEEDKSWALDVAAKVPPGNERKFSIFPYPEWEIDAFRKLLCAMYNRPYTVSTPDELRLMTSLADFYCAIPILSATLASGLLGSPMFEPELFNSYYLNAFARLAPDLIHTAYKLRNPVLFRECFVHVVGRWECNDDDDEGVSDTQKELIEKNVDIWRLVSSAFGRIRQQLLEVNRSLIIALSRCEFELGAQLDLLESGVSGAENAKFYKAVLHILDLEDVESHSENLEELQGNLREVLMNNLVLDKTGYGSGEGSYEPYFLSADVSDEDMPWDDTQVDW